MGQVYVPVAILLLVTLELVYAAQEIDLLANHDELDKPRQRRNFHPNYEVSRGSYMSRTCDIDKTHESHQLIHYLETLGESDDTIIRVESPKNIQQCRSTIYEYGIVNNIKDCECKVSVQCKVLNGGGCSHHHSGGYNLYLELRDAWSAKTTTSRGSERICEGKTYHRTLVNNDMIVLRMTLHDDPQDRNSDEKFICTVQRSCYKKNGENHAYKTDDEASPPKSHGPPGYYDYSPPFQNYDRYHTSHGSSDYPAYAPNQHHLDSVADPYGISPGHFEQKNLQDHVYHVYHHYQPNPNLGRQIDRKWKRSLNHFNTMNHGGRVLAYQPNRKLHAITHYVPH